MITWFTKNDVAANLLMLTIALAGVFSLFKLIPLEFFPNFESNRVIVDVSLRGSTPEDAELGLATRIEAAIKDLEGVDSYSSESFEGGTSVSIEAQKNYDARELLENVKNRIDTINTFPGEAERPSIYLAQRRRAAITLTLAGEVSEREMREQADRLLDEILLLPNVNQATVQGVRQYEIAIELRQDKLREYDLSLDEVSSAISRSSLDLSAGNIVAAGGDVLIRSKGQAYQQDEFESIVIKTNPDGTLLRLGDIAQVADGFEEKAIRTRFDGHSAALIDIYSTDNQSMIEVCDEVKDFVESKRQKMTGNLDIHVWNDRSLIIKKRINTLTSNALQGGILVILLLSLFLRPSVAFWVFLGIPVSFCGAWLTMPLLGVSFNMLSLFAFIVVLGIVVDDAIVTGENVYSHLQKSKDGLSAAINGTREVAVPVTFGVLTTVVAFAPLLFIEGRRGALFAQIPLIVVPVLLFSLIESKLVLPAHLKHIKLKDDDRQNPIMRWQRGFANGFERAILKYYQPLLAKCLDNKFSTLATFFGLLAIIVVAFNLGHTRYTFFPRIPSETVRVYINMPTGTSFAITDKHMDRVLESAQTLQDKYIDERTGVSIIEGILARTGGFGGQSHVGYARFEVVSPENRSIKISSPELAREWRKLIGDIPGAESITFRAELGRASDPIDVELRSEKLETLELAADELKAFLGQYSGVFDINDSFSSGKEELLIELTPEAHLLGLSRSDVIRQVRQGFFGVQAQRIQRGKNDVRVMVRFPQSERKSVAHLNNMLIRTSTDQQIPLSEIAILKTGLSPTEIRRIDGYRVANVTADIEKTNVNMTALGAEMNTFLQEIAVRYPGLSFKLGGEQEEEAESMASMLLGLGVVLFIIFCLLAIPFRSYSQPLVVMLVIPFGVIGAVVGHWIMGMNLTIFSLMGMLALVGVLVNDSLVLVDYINKKVAEGMKLEDALLTAGSSRFRPVMLTSLTTFFGLLPLLLNNETQAQFLIPMAISLGFGIMFATFITLLLVPINYMLLAQLKASLSGAIGTKTTNTLIGKTRS